jgi:hypothetical protein
MMQINTTNIITSPNINHTVPPTKLSTNNNIAKMIKNINKQIIIISSFSTIGLDFFAWFIPDVCQSMSPTFLLE